MLIGGRQTERENVDSRETEIENVDSRYTDGDVDCREIDRDGKC